MVRHDEGTGVGAQVSSGGTKDQWQEPNKLRGLQEPSQSLCINMFKRLGFWVGGFRV